jgi:hypothetical protein
MLFKRPRSQEHAPHIDGPTGAVTEQRESSVAMPGPYGPPPVVVRPRTADRRFSGTIAILSAIVFWVAPCCFCPLGLLISGDRTSETNLDPGPLDYGVSAIVPMIWLVVEAISFVAFWIFVARWWYARKG